MMPGEHPTHTVEVHKAKVVSLQTGATLNGRTKEDKAPPKLRFTLVRFADLKADNEPEYLCGDYPRRRIWELYGDLQRRANHFGSSICLCMSPSAGRIEAWKYSKAR